MNEQDLVLSPEHPEHKESPPTLLRLEECNLEQAEKYYPEVNEELIQKGYAPNSVFDRTLSSYDFKDLYTKLTETQVEQLLAEGINLESATVVKKYYPKLVFVYPHSPKKNPEHDPQYDFELFKELAKWSSAKILKRILGVDFSVNDLRTLLRLGAKPEGVYESYRFANGMRRRGELKLPWIEQIALLSKFDIGDANSFERKTRDAIRAGFTFEEIVKYPFLASSLLKSNSSLEQ